ncbi:HEPN domain-containing protein [Bacillus cereus group sp. Bce005]|uniref:HEPN domain-containing protein n=1 Tax=Bacillus cereus group TaxID=86661 RepID=UPI003015448C
MRKEVSNYYGKWYIEGFDAKLNGFLEVNHQEKIYHLTVYSEEPIELPHFADLVYGKSFKGNSFALVDCWLRQSVSSSYVHDYKSRYEIIIECKYILEGCFYKTKDEILIKRLDFKLSNMDVWAYKDPVEVEFNKGDGYLIKAKQPENLNAKYEDFMISVDYVLMPDFYTRESHKFTINIDCNFKLEFDAPVLLARAIDIVNQVRDFLTLCTGNRIYIENILATPVVPVKILDINMPFEIYGPGIEKGVENDIPKLSFVDIKLGLNAIEMDFEKVFQNWFLKHEKLKPVIDLFVGIYYQRTSYERHFLNAVQALEAYHRLTRKNEVLPKRDHKFKIQSIVTTVPVEYREWLQGKLNFSNEPSLHERLADLFEPIKDIDNEFYPDSYFLFSFIDKDKEALIRDIKNTRNYNTHFDENLKKKAVKGEELAQLTNLLITMLGYYLMKELGLNEELILKIAREEMNRISSERSYLNAIRKNNMN